MLKSSLALALPIAALGVALAQTTPESRAAYLAEFRGMIGIEHTVSHSQVDDRDRGKVLSVRAEVGVARGTTALDANGHGQYETEMDIGGRIVSALVDTGATYVVLSYQDAADIGIRPTDQAFTVVMSTANGLSRCAPTLIRHIRVGNVEAYDVQALVASPGALTLHSLLGMSFLQKLSGFRIDDGRLVLRQ